MKVILPLALLATCLASVAPAVDQRAAPAAASATTKPNDDVTKLAADNNGFGLTLYRQLAKDEKGNMFFSPLSIETALAMTKEGARGDTAAQMTKTLHLSMPAEKLSPAFAAMMTDLNGDGKKRPYQLSIANALWGKNDFDFSEEYLKLVKDNYDGHCVHVDFKANAEASRLAINKWVEGKTNDKIKELLQPGTVNSLTRLVLTNAVYFLGTWEKQFDKTLTQDGEFTTLAGEKITTPMMHQTARFDYAEFGQFQALKMPYRGGDLSMVILLPNKADNLDDLERMLAAAFRGNSTGDISRIIAGMQSHLVEVSMPKFQSTSQFVLNKPLEAMGMKDAFDSAKADFSGMMNEMMKDGRIPEGRLYVSGVIHKAFVDVNEEGTEAAAATAVIIVGRGMPPTPKIFNANRPFAYLIRHEETGAILFMGRMANPAEAGDAKSEVHDGDKDAERQDLSVAPVMRVEADASASGTGPKASSQPTSSPLGLRPRTLPSVPASQPAEWGEPVWSAKEQMPDGGLIQWGLRRVSGERPYRMGQTVRYQLLLKNVGDKDTIAYRTDSQWYVRQGKLILPIMSCDDMLSGIPHTFSYIVEAGSTKIVCTLVLRLDSPSAASGRLVGVIGTTRPSSLAAAAVDTAFERAIAVSPGKYAVICDLIEKRMFYDEPHVSLPLEVLPAAPGELAGPDVTSTP